MCYRWTELQKLVSPVHVYHRLQPEFNWLQEQLDKAVEYLLKAINFAKKSPRYVSIIAYSCFEKGYQKKVHATILKGFLWYDP